MLPPNLKTCNVSILMIENIYRPMDTDMQETELTQELQSDMSRNYFMTKISSCLLEGGVLCESKL